MFCYHLDYQQPCQQQMQPSEKNSWTITTASIISNAETGDIIKTVKSLDESELQTKGISEIVKNEVK